MGLRRAWRAWLALGVGVAACKGDSLDPAGGAVASVVIRPPTATVAVGASVRLEVDMLDGSGRPLTGRKVVWATSNATIAIISSAGVVTGVSVGTAQVAASAEGKSAVAQIAVNPTPVASVRLSPTSRNLLVGETVQLTAEPLDTQGNVLPGRPVAFTTSNATVATVNDAGLATALAPGSTIITAASEGKSAVATITVASVPVASVVVTPNTGALVVGQTTQLQAEVRDANGQPLPGRAVSWTSDASQVATVTSTGLVTAVSPGTATISAASEGKTGTATITVSPKPVSAVIISPGQLSVTEGQTAQLTAQVTDEQGNVLPGRPITFTSSNTAVATVSGSGVVTGVAPGSATVTATSEGKSGTATVTVTPISVASVTVSPPTPDVIVGETVQLTATALSGSGQPLSGRPVTWSSGAPTIVSVSATGVMTGLALGTAVVFASIEGVIGTATATVRLPTVATVEVTPPSASVAIGGTVQLSARTLDATGNELSGRLVGWSSSDPSVATVSSAGLVTGVKEGAATITASSEGASGTAAITVTGVPVASVTVTPSSASLTVGETVTLEAKTLDGNGGVLTGRTVAWSTSNANVATVTQAGVVSAVGAGSATITATSEGKSGTATVTVTAPAPDVGSVTVAPATATVNVAFTTQLTATVRDVDGGVIGGASVAWSSDAPLVASVSQSGVVTGLLPGTATITANSGGKSGTASVTVQLAPVATVTVSPSTLNLRDRDGQRTGTLTATLLDALGNVLTGRSVTWASSNTAVATVSDGGVVTAVKEGTATVTATSEGQSGSATVNVRK